MKLLAKKLTQAYRLIPGEVYVNHKWYPMGIRENKRVKAGITNKEVGAVICNENFTVLEVDANGKDRVYVKVLTKSCSMGWISISQESLTSIEKVT
jgi:hypothetical protein